MTTSNAAAADASSKNAEKGHEKEKLAEKRRALGRGLESLLPGPRMVPAPPGAPPTTAKDAATTLKAAPSAMTPPQETREQPDASGFSSDASSATPPGVPPQVPPDAISNAPAASHAISGNIETLQASSAAPEPDGEHAFELSLDQIDQNPYQTRQEFDQKALTDLAGSIQTQGVLQPIVVRPKTHPPLTSISGAPRFVLILGERRYRASKILGKTTIPAIVKRVSEQQAAEMTLVENLQRQDLDCLEQAQAFANLSTDFKLTQDEIGKRVGISREQVSNYLRLLKLPPSVLAALRRKQLTYSHARLLLSLHDDRQIAKVAELAITRRLSVAALNDLVMNINLPRGSEERAQSGARWVDPNVRAAQRSLEIVLGMKVRIRDRKGKGNITIEYATLEDFDRLLQMLKGKKASAGDIAQDDPEL